MNYLKINKDVQTEVRKSLDYSEEDIDRDIKILKAWIVKQPHLPQGVQDDIFFETTLIRNKSRVEKAKKAIDNYYTLKTAYPDMFTEFEEMIPSKINERMLPLTPLTHKHLRVCLNYIESSDSDDYDLERYCSVIFAGSEILNKYDYYAGVHVLVDMRKYDMSFIKAFSPSVFFKLQKMLQQGYSNRIKYIDFYKPGGWISSLLGILRLGFPQKLYERIRIIKDDETLHQYIPKEILPKEYGGDAKPVDELLADWDKVFEENRSVLRDAVKYRSNERLRLDKSRLDVEIFGTDGSFKKLNLD